MGRRRHRYAVYKGDQLICFGTTNEIAEKLGVKPATVRWWSYPSALKRNKGNARTAIKLCS